MFYHIASKLCFTLEIISLHNYVPVNFVLLVFLISYINMLKAKLYYLKYVTIVDISLTMAAIKCPSYILKKINSSNIYNVAL